MAVGYYYVNACGHIVAGPMGIVEAYEIYNDISANAYRTPIKVSIVRDPEDDEDEDEDDDDE